MVKLSVVWQDHGGLFAFPEEKSACHSGDQSCERTFMNLGNRLNQATYVPVGLLQRTLPVLVLPQEGNRKKCQAAEDIFVIQRLTDFGFRQAINTIDVVPELAPEPMISWKCCTVGTLAIKNAFNSRYNSEPWWAPNATCARNQHLFRSPDKPHQIIRAIQFTVTKVKEYLGGLRLLSILALFYVRIIYLFLKIRSYLPSINS